MLPVDTDQTCTQFQGLMVLKKKRGNLIFASSNITLVFVGEDNMFILHKVRSTNISTKMLFFCHCASVHQHSGFEMKQPRCDRSSHFQISFKEFKKRIVLTVQQLQSPFFRGSKVIEALNDKQLHIQMRPLLSLFNER